MIIDYLDNIFYYNFQQPLLTAFTFLQQPHIAAIPDGKYEIAGNFIFAIVNSYETVLSENECMESHTVYTDIHYIVSGSEQIGHGFLNQPLQQKLIDETNDCITYITPPLFYTHLKQGMFAVFFPTDVHKPGIYTVEKTLVKKIVIKIALPFTTI